MSARRPISVIFANEERALEVLNGRADCARGRPRRRRNEDIFGEFLSLRRLLRPRGLVGVGLSCFG